MATNEPIAPSPQPLTPCRRGLDVELKRTPVIQAGLAVPTTTSRDCYRQSADPNVNSLRLILPDTRDPPTPHRRSLEDEQDQPAGLDLQLYRPSPYRRHRIDQNLKLI